MMEVDWSSVGRRVNEVMRDRNMSSEWIASKAGINRKTVDRLRKGDRIQQSSLSYIEKVLGVDLVKSELNLDSKAKCDNIAPAELGAYSYDMISHYIGKYYMFRKSYDYSNRVICSYISISWNSSEDRLDYQELQNNKRSDGKIFKYVFDGRISIPAGLSITQFIGSAGKGFHRVMTTTALRGQDAPYFKGVLLGINELADIGFYPATSPVFIEKILDDNINLEQIGSFDQDELWHANALDQLRSARDSFYCKILG